MKLPLPVLAIVVALVTVSACKKGGGGKTVPDPLGPGEVINVVLCGSTTEPKNPCQNFPDNSIEIRLGTTDGSQQCPCFSFTFLNQNLTDLGSPFSNYEFTGFRPGSYTVTGQFNTRSVFFTFAHNTSTSTIGVVPASLQNLTGPGTSSGCQIAYNTGSSLNRVTTTFSFQFDIAAATSGGSC